MAQVLLECEGDALDMSGDMGAVGRFSVSSAKEKGEDELLLDLKGNVPMHLSKVLRLSSTLSCGSVTFVPLNEFFLAGIIYKTTIVPSNTFFVVSITLCRARYGPCHPSKDAVPWCFDIPTKIPPEYRRSFVCTNLC